MALFRLHVVKFRRDVVEISLLNLQNEEISQEQKYFVDTFRA